LEKFKPKRIRLLPELTLRKRGQVIVWTESCKFTKVGQLSFWDREASFKGGPKVLPKSLDAHNLPFLFNWGLARKEVSKKGKPLHKRLAQGTNIWGRQSLRVGSLWEHSRCVWAHWTGNRGALFGHVGQLAPQILEGGDTHPGRNFKRAGGFFQQKAPIGELSFSFLCGTTHMMRICEPPKGANTHFWGEIGPFLAY